MIYDDVGREREGDDRTTRNKWLTIIEHKWAYAHVSIDARVVLIIWKKQKEIECGRALSLFHSLSFSLVVQRRGEEWLFQSSKTVWLLFFFSRPCCAAYIAILEIMKKGQTTVEMIQYFSMSIAWKFSFDCIYFRRLLSSPFDVFFLFSLHWLVITFST